jgi:hypothetical protein
VPAARTREREREREERERERKKERGRVLLGGGQQTGEWTNWITGRVEKLVHSVDLEKKVLGITLRRM